MKTMDLNVIKLRQKGTDIYLTAMEAKNFLEHVAVDKWEESNQDGYQRALTPARPKAVADYLLEEEGTFPTSVLVNLRTPIDFEAKQILSDGLELGVIKLADEDSFWVIDGQHRVEGLRKAIERNSIFAQYPIIVSLFGLTDRFAEMRQFYIVNARQKSVPTDLAQRHLYKMYTRIGAAALLRRERERDVFGAQALPLVDALRTDSKSPWCGRIQLANERKTQSHVIKQRPFADSIYYIFRERRKFRERPDELKEHLINYWNALKVLFPEAFAQPSDYTIQKTTGTYSLHMTFPRVYEICELDGDYSMNKMENILESMFKHLEGVLGAEVNSAFWHKRNGHPLVIATSQKMIKALGEQFIECLPR